jgi:hypothetical protein
MTATEQWEVEIEHMMACNCHFGCPCTFNAPPTFGTCESALAYHIVRGAYGDVPLAGLNWVLAAIWPGPLHDGNGRAVLYLDDRALGAQRQALEAIATGRAGGPIGIFMSTVTAGIEVRTAAIDLRAAGKDSWFRVQHEVEVTFAPIRNPVTGAEHLPSVLLPTGLLTKRDDFFAAETFAVRAREDLTFAYPGRNALAFRSTWSGATIQE